MTYVIAERCIGVKDASCVSVCPVDCIHPTPDEPDFVKVDQLYIDPGVCIDCDICASVCPVDAIYEGGEVPEESSGYLDINALYFRTQPVGFDA